MLTKFLAAIRRFFEGSGMTEEERYLSQARDPVDLEMRQREWDRRRKYESGFGPRWNERMGRYY